VNGFVQLKRETPAIAIPSGTASILPAGTGVNVMQFLGSSWTVTSALGMYRIDVKDADALGLAPPTEQSPSGEQPQFSEKLVWDQLKTVYDPEIPVDIYELGLIYDILVDAEKRALIKMTLTSPACPSAQQIPSEVRYKVKAVPGIADAWVEIVWEPPWGKERMSEAARLQLGFF